MTVAPIDTGDLSAALRAHGESVMLPAVAYTGEDVYAWERRHVFAGGWTCLGRVGELTGSGDAAGSVAALTHRAIEVGDVGVLLTATDGGLRAFANVCRHRGHELLPIGGVAGHRAVVCPYHGWSYRLDGGLRAAPGMDGDRPDDLDLVELPLATWHGWVFVNATGRAPAFERYAGAMAGIVAPHRAEDLTVGVRHTLLARVYLDPDGAIEAACA
jgi:Rieske 2Fe-2S family protein